MIYPIAIHEISIFKNEDEYLMQLNTFLEVKKCLQESDHVKIATVFSSLNMN
jgi:hypothetical protein